MACSDLESARIDCSVRTGERPSDRERKRERGRGKEKSLLSGGTGSIFLADSGDGGCCCCISETPHLACSEGTVWARRRRRRRRPFRLLAIRPCTFDSRSARWNAPPTIHSHRVFECTTRSQGFDADEESVDRLYFRFLLFFLSFLQS